MSELGFIRKMANGAENQSRPDIFISNEASNDQLAERGNMWMGIEKEEPIRGRSE